MLGGEFDTPRWLSRLNLHRLTTLCGYVLAVGLDADTVPKKDLKQLTNCLYLC